MRFGAMFLAGDSAHIVPPTGAKGLNLAMSDIHYLSEALTGSTRPGTSEALDGYSDKALDAGLAGDPVLLVDDVDPAPLPGSGRVRSEACRRWNSRPCAIWTPARGAMAMNYVGLPL